MNSYHNGSSRPGSMKHGITAKNCTGSHKIWKKRKRREMIKMRDGVSSPTQCGQMPWGMTVFFQSFSFRAADQLSHVVARIEEIEKSQWIKDSGKELDLDLYRELTWLYRLLQGKNRDGQKGNIWEHLQHQQSFHFPTAHCNDAASKIISPSYPMLWIEIMSFCLVLI